jgi:Domain of unknown function (DUF6602)
MAEADPGTVADLAGPAPAFDLGMTFALRQEQLLATLGVGRAVGAHPVAVGDDTELNWRGMLESILPARYRVGKGFAVDADGGRSEQVDLLVYDRHFSPVLLDVGEYVFVPAEAVYAVLEVKQELSKATIEYAGGKVESVRKLRRTSAPVPYVEGQYEPKPLHPILGGLLTMESAWTPPLGDSLTRVLEDAPAAPDLGCALRHGSFEVAAKDGSLVKSRAEKALIFFVLTLLKRLQPLASVPAIIYDEYARVLGVGPTEEQNDV